MQLKYHFPPPDVFLKLSHRCINNVHVLSAPFTQKSIFGIKLSNYAFTICGRTPYPDTDSAAVCILYMWSSSSRFTPLLTTKLVQSVIQICQRIFRMKVTRLKSFVCCLVLIKLQQRSTLQLTHTSWLYLQKAQWRIKLPTSG